LPIAVPAALCEASSIFMQQVLFAVGGNFIGIEGDFTHHLVAYDVFFDRNPIFRDPRHG
jgi:hypothetical protein